MQILPLGCTGSQWYWFPGCWRHYEGRAQHYRTNYGSLPVGGGWCRLGGRGRLLRGSYYDHCFGSGNSRYPKSLGAKMVGQSSILRVCIYSENIPEQLSIISSCLEEMGVDIKSVKIREEYDKNSREQCIMLVMELTLINSDHIKIFALPMAFNLCGALRVQRFVKRKEAWNYV